MIDVQSILHTGARFNAYERVARLLKDEALLSGELNPRLLDENSSLFGYDLDMNRLPVTPNADPASARQQLQLASKARDEAEAAQTDALEHRSARNKAKTVSEQARGRYGAAGQHRLDGSIGIGMKAHIRKRSGRSSARQTEWRLAFLDFAEVLREHDHQLRRVEPKARALRRLAFCLQRDRTWDPLGGPANDNLLADWMRLGEPIKISPAAGFRSRSGGSAKADRRAHTPIDHQAACGAPRWRSVK